jgi:hypothetical protein
MVTIQRVIRDVQKRARLVRSFGVPPDVGVPVAKRLFNNSERAAILSP